MSAETTWFYEKDGERMGPVDSSTVKELVSSEEITIDSLVWREGMTDWAPLRSTELSGSGITAAASKPPPVPPRDMSLSRAEENPMKGENVLQPVSSTAEIPARDLVLKSGFRVQIRSSFGRAWELMKTDFWPFVGMFALMTIVLSVACYLGVTILFLTFPILVGYNWYVFRRMRGEAAAIEDLFFGFKRRFGSLAVLNLILMTPIFVITIIGFFALTGLIIYAEEGGGSKETVTAAIVVLVVLGVLFFIVVGGIVSMIGYLASLLIVDCDLPWKEALSKTWDACRGNLVKLILFYFVFMTLSFLGVLVFYLGAFVTGAWGSIAINQIYDDAFGDA
ncbi:MAG: DUF4339 domain-containing protein [Verrucomicrobiota bacterium]